MPTVPSPLADRFRTRAADRPDAVAVISEELTLTYGGLREMLDRGVAELAAAGVAPGDVVEVRAHRDVRLPAALLAVWETGATASVVNATLPSAYLEECTRVARPHWHLDMADGSPFALNRTERERAPSSAEPASHVLFTSGTTGRPAAVAVDRGVLERCLSWYRKAFTPGPADRVALLSGPGHDPVLRDVLVPLLHGGALVVPPHEAFTDPHRLLASLEHAGVTIVHCTPGLLELLLVADTAMGGHALEGIRLVVSSGAPLPWGTVRALRRRTGAAVVNAYGATETPQTASMRLVTEEYIAAHVDEPDHLPVDVGFGVAGAELLLASADGPSGPDADTGRGEVVVRSPNLARGYLADSGRDGRFSPDPQGDAGYRVYRTGDLGERRPDGSVRVLGRLDRQMMINGFRIEAAEIEHAVIRHPAVAAAHARPVIAPTGDVIELSVVLSDPPATDARALRAHLRAVLPAHAVPARIRVVPAPVLDANHKVTLGSVTP